MQRGLRLVVCSGAVAAVTVVAFRIIPVNATTAGFAYLLLVLAVASTWGFFEASWTSIAATLTFNRYFFEPIGTFTIADPQNWVALFSFLVTALVASRLSDRAKRRALDAIERHRDVERLYTFSRAILLSGGQEPFPNQLIRKLTETFALTAAALYDRHSGEFHRTGVFQRHSLDDQLRHAALHGSSFVDAGAHRTITAVRLGSEPIASVALEGARMPDSVLQGIANLVAIGLERAKAQALAQQVEAARQSEQLRTTVIDAMAHEFKTPLTLIKGATSSVLAGRDALSASAREQLTIADEEAEHLRALIDNAIEMARLDTANIHVHLEESNISVIVGEVLASMQAEIDSRPVEIFNAEGVPAVPPDRRLVKLALKQLLDNALKYSPPDSGVEIRVRANQHALTVEVMDHGAGIPLEESRRIFEGFYRGRSTRDQIPGSGLGLTIAQSIVDAHQGELSVTSQPGLTVFRMSLPIDRTGGANH